MRLILVNNNEGSGDWEGLYINGELELEDHSVDLSRALKLLKEKGEVIDSIHVVSVTDDDVCSGLPSNFIDLGIEL